MPNLPNDLIFSGRKSVSWASSISWFPNRLVSHHARSVELDADEHALDWCATRGKHEQGIKTLAKINGSVSGYNVEEQYEIMVKTVEHEKALAAISKREKWYNIFRGVDGFRTLVSMWAITAQQFLGLKVVCIDAICALARMCVSHANKISSSRIRPTSSALPVSKIHSKHL
jgi:hypothetical protein